MHWNLNPMINSHSPVRTATGFELTAFAFSNSGSGTWWRISQRQNCRRSSIASNSNSIWSRAIPETEPPEMLEKPRAGTFPRLLWWCHMQEREDESNACLSAGTASSCVEEMLGRAWTTPFATDRFCFLKPWCTPASEGIKSISFQIGPDSGR